MVSAILYREIQRKRKNQDDMNLYYALKLSERESPIAVDLIKKNIKKRIAKETRIYRLAYSRIYKRQCGDREAAAAAARAAVIASVSELGEATIIHNKSCSITQRQQSSQPFGNDSTATDFKVDHMLAEPPKSSCHRYQLRGRPCKQQPQQQTTVTQQQEQPLRKQQPRQKQEESLLLPRFPQHHQATMQNHNLAPIRQQAVNATSTNQVATAATPASTIYKHGKTHTQLVQHYTNYYHLWNEQAEEARLACDAVPGNSLAIRKEKWATYYAINSAALAHYHLGISQGNAVPCQRPQSPLAPPQLSNSVAAQKPAAAQQPVVAHQIRTGTAAVRSNAPEESKKKKSRLAKVESEETNNKNNNGKLSGKVATPASGNNELKDCAFKSRGRRKRSAAVVETTERHVKRKEEEEKSHHSPTKHKKGTPDHRKYQKMTFSEMQLTIEQNSKEINLLKEKLKNSQEDLEIQQETTEQMAVILDTWHSRFDRVYELAEAAGVDAALLRSIRDGSCP